MPAPLNTEALDRLLEPFAGAPQDILGVVLDACRYPSDLLDALRWSQQPEATRGPVKESWPPTVRLLAEQAPRTLDFLTHDLASTAALGSAYQNQPNEVWLAYGRVTSARQAQGQEPATDVASSQAPPLTASPAPPSEAPQQLPGPAAAPATEGMPSTQAPQAMVTAPPAASGPSTVGAALAGGVVGLGAGLLISELTHDNDGWGSGYGAPYVVPPPYLPFAGGGGAYNAARDLQQSRQAAARELQANRQGFADRSREDRHDFAAGQRQQRQAAEQQRQEQRQDARSDREAQRQGARGDQQTQRRQAQQSDGPHQTRAGGATERRAQATAGQLRARQASPAAQRATSVHPALRSSAPQRAWGPTQGMSGDRLAAARSRQPPAGFHGGGRGARGGHLGRR
jgi:hypothetical protein